MGYVGKNRQMSMPTFIPQTVILPTKTLINTLYSREKPDPVNLISKSAKPNLLIINRNLQSVKREKPGPQALIIRLRVVSRSQ